MSTQIPASSQDEIGVLSRAFQQMSRDLKSSYEQLEDYSHTLEHKVAERTDALNHTLAEVETINKKIVDSINYAKMIQRSLLPDMDEIKNHLPDNFFIWMPRDIVGGDIFYADFFPDGFIIAVIDCTGHGVPGAFMTMIASSALKRVIHDEACKDPCRILTQLNFIVKTLLKQDTDRALSDDGLDAAIVCVRKRHDAANPENAGSWHEETTLTFAGARLPLICVHNNEMNIIKGDRKSIGYKRTDLDATFTNHEIRAAEGMVFYMATDGYADQMGGPVRRRFGSKRFKELLLKNKDKSFDIQRQEIIRTINEYRGDNERLDDITVVGFAL